MGKSEKRTRVVAYARVSTDAQANEGVSLDAQQARMRAYGEALGLEIVGS
jgi:DNA invertase Pin-like site-specific DNA recombinase